MRPSKLTITILAALSAVAISGGVSWAATDGWFNRGYQIKALKGPDGGPVAERGTAAGSQMVQVEGPTTAVTESPFCQRSNSTWVRAGQDAGLAWLVPNAWYDVDVEDGTVVSGTGASGCWANGEAPSGCTDAPKLRPNERRTLAFEATTWVGDPDAGHVEYISDAGCEEAWGEGADAAVIACHGDAGVWVPEPDAGQYHAAVYVESASTTTAIGVTFSPARTCIPDGGW